MKKLIILGALITIAEICHAQLPTANFTVNRRTLCPGTAITFTDNSTNAVTWNWTFEGGNPGSSNSQNPPGVTYNTPGRYDVTLTVTNAFGMNNMVQTDWINVIECKASEGIYRIPYADGTTISITRDHLTHSPSPVRIDMVGTGGGPYQIVAAADGWIRWIVDDNTECCNTFGACSNCNNYVWIEHPNGEWTKYTHFMTGTVTSRNFAGHRVGDFVCAGAYLGDEGDVGASSGSGRAGFSCGGSATLQNSIDSLNAVRIGNGLDSMRCAQHLHFEVAVPDDDTNPFDTLGGFINGENRIPIICDISGNYFVDGDNLTANPCDNNACEDTLSLQNQSFNMQDVALFQANDLITAQNNFNVNAGANVVMNAGNRIQLLPGFRAITNGYYHARIGICNESKGVLCNVKFKNSAVSESELHHANEGVKETIISVYPNPSRTAFNIEYSVKEETEVSLNLLDLFGKTVMEIANDKGHAIGVVHKLTFDASQLRAGAYFCVLRAGGETRVVKVLKMD